MARDFGPFPSKPMYEVVNRRMQRALAEATSSTGFVKSGQGAVTAGTGAQLVIAAYPDGALIDGLYVENPASETVDLSTITNTSTNPRMDRLVMRLDMGAQTIAPFVIQGTPAASPQAPPLTQTATVYDMPLCRYTMPGSGSAQNPASIVDERTLAVADWVSYSPTWTASNGGASIGNGSLVGRYRKTGRLVEVDILLTLGSSSNGGVGAYSFGLPFPTAAGREHRFLVGAYVAGDSLFTGFASAASGSSTVSPFLPLSATSSRLSGARNADATTLAGTGVPAVSGQYTFGAGHNLSISGRYESAS